MKKYELKCLKFLFLAVITAGLSICSALAQPDLSRAELLAKLIAKLGPEKTAEFVSRLEAKHKTMALPPEKSSPARSPRQPKPKPTKPQPPVVVEVPKQKPAAPQPLSIDQEDRHHFDQIVEKINTYMRGAFSTVKGFLDKNNNHPYKTHVANFKTQLQYLREELLHQYPQAQTPEGAKLFKALQEIAKALEKGQELMVNAIDYNYGTGYTAAPALGLALRGLAGPVSKQQAVIDKEIGILRNDLRRAKETAMLKKVDDMYKVINQSFDYSKTKPLPELMNAIQHRVKR